VRHIPEAGIEIWFFEEQNSGSGLPWAVSASLRLQPEGISETSTLRPCASRATRSRLAL
jgi:hypothetical protein